MPHGHPDYGAGAPTSTIYPILDIGELAARLGSIVTFDRRGNILWMDDFENGVGKWMLVGSSGKTATMSHLYARNGGFSCELKTPASASSYAEIYRFLPYPILSKMGLEVSVHNEAAWKEFIIVFTLFDGTNAHVAKITYEHSTHKFYYADSSNVNQETGIVSEFFTGGNLSGTIKLVVDFSAKEYARLIVNNQSVDLSGKGLRSTTNPTASCLAGALYVYNSGSDAALAYIDDVILTQNEP